MTDIEIFKNEEFGEIRTVVIDNEPWFVAADVCKALEIDSSATRRLDDDEKSAMRLTQTSSNGVEQDREMTVVNEPGLYTLVLGSRKPEAKAFKRWITHDVIPVIRKTGGYVNDTETFVDAYFAGIPEEMKAIIRVSLDTIKIKDKIIEEQKQTIAEKDKEIEHKEDVICGLVDDIDLATKRQRITQIIRFHSKTGEVIADKWNLLYSEFEKKYHVNLSVRFNNHEDTYKPKLKNKVDLIDRQMDMIPQLYEVCCKLFENDVKMLKEEWESAIAC